MARGAKGRRFWPDVVIYGLLTDDMSPQHNNSYIASEPSNAKSWNFWDFWGYFLKRLFWCFPSQEKRENGKWVWVVVTNKTMISDAKKSWSLERYRLADIVALAICLEQDYYGSLWCPHPLICTHKSWEGVEHSNASCRLLGSPRTFSGILKDEFRAGGDDDKVRPKRW